MCGSQSAVSNSTSVMSSHYTINRHDVHLVKNNNDYIHRTNEPNMTAINASIIRDLLDMRFNMQYGGPSPLNSDEISILMDYICTI